MQPKIFLNSIFKFSRKCQKKSVCVRRFLRCMSCEAKNLIYVIKCKGCDEEYIWETGDTLRHRLTVHRQQIRDARVRILYVSNHIANCARFQPVKFTILPLYKMQTDCVSARKMKEQHFIGLLKPKLNKSI